MSDDIAALRERIRREAHYAAILAAEWLQDQAPVSVPAAPPVATTGSAVPAVRLQSELAARDAEIAALRRIIRMLRGLS